MESRATVALVLGCTGRCRQISVLIVLLPLLRVAQDGIRVANGCWQRMEILGFKHEEECSLANHISTHSHKLLVLDRVIFEGLSACKGLFVLSNNSSIRSGSYFPFLAL